MFAEKRINQNEKKNNKTPYLHTNVIIEAEDSFHKRRTCCGSSRWQVLRLKGHETQSEGHLRHRGRPSAENQHRPFKCERWNQSANTPPTMGRMGEIAFCSTGLRMNEVIMGFWEDNICKDTH